MPSNSATVLVSIRRWLLTVAILLGVCVVALADIAYTVSNEQNGIVSAAVGVTGGVLALRAGLNPLGSVTSAE